MLVFLHLEHNCLTELPEEIGRLTHIDNLVSSAQHCYIFTLTNWNFTKYSFHGHQSLPLCKSPNYILEKGISKKNNVHCKFLHSDIQ